MRVVMGEKVIQKIDIDVHGRICKKKNKRAKRIEKEMIRKGAKRMQS